MLQRPIRTIALVGCSDGLAHPNPAISWVCRQLEAASLSIRIFPSIWESQPGRSAPAAARAADLTNAFLDPSVDAIFDGSGGDLANGVLPYLQLDLLRQHAKPFFGYSDLSVLLNALGDAGIPTYHFQIRMLYANPAQLPAFLHALQGDVSDWMQISYRFLQGTSLTGTIAGGNIRCVLKLIGTPWQPDFRNRILFLESRSGGLNRMETMLHQYQQIGAFQQCKGVLLGTFTEIQKLGQVEQLYQIIQQLVPDRPIVCTQQLGHAASSKCLAYQTVHTFSQENQTAP